PEIATLPGGLGNHWEPVMSNVTGTPTHVQGNMPLLGPFDLFYINNPAAPWTEWDPNWGSGTPGSPSNNKCDSHEVVFDIQGMQLHSQAITGGSVPKTLYMGFVHHPFTLWQNSSLNLTTY